MKRVGSFQDRFRHPCCGLCFGVTVEPAAAAGFPMCRPCRAWGRSAIEAGGGARHDRGVAAMTTLPGLCARLAETLDLERALVAPTAPWRHADRLVAG